MSLVVKEGLMTEGDISVDVNYTPELYDLLWDAQTDQPRTLYMLVKDPDDVLAYPPFVFRRLDGDERGLTIGGPGILWDLGSGDVGPTIEDAEYLSGADMLSNGDLLLGDLYWRRPSEGSLWLVASGMASNLGGLGKDDVFEYDFPFPSRPGNEYQAIAHGVTAIGRVRIRTIYAGRFNPPNLFPTITAGAWDTVGQVSNNPHATNPGFFIDGAVLKGRTPFPIYQLVENGTFVDLFDHWFTDLPPGFGATQWVADGSASPDLATSVHYEGSGFITTDVVITDASDVLTSATADWTSPDATGMLVEGPDIPAYTYVVGVSAPGTLQMSALATADHLAGDQSVAFRPQQTNRTYLTTDAENLGTTLSQYEVLKGERWTLVGNVMHTGNANGTATISFAKIKEATDDTLAGLFPEQAATFSTGGQLTLSTLVEGPVKAIQKETTIEDETTHLGVFIDLKGNTDGRWWFSNFRLYRFGGNKDWIEAAAPLDLTPERTYEFRLPCAPGPALNKDAKARLLVHLTSDSRPPFTLVSSDQGPLKEGETATPVIVLSVTPPSGYTLATAELMIEDTYNDVFSFGEMTVVDTDRSTMVFDGLTIDPTDDSPFVDSIAPEGTESVRVAVVVEDGTSALTLDGVSLVRTDKAPATGNAIAADILSGTSILPGTITCPETLLADWRLINLTRRAALDHYATVASSPPREYRVNAVDPPTLDMAERFTLHVDHAPDHPTSPVVLVDAHIKDPDVEDIDPPEVDVTDRPSHIKLIGTDRQLVSGGTVLINATAVVPVPTEYGYYNQPMERTRIVSSGTVDHEGYASGLAADLAEAAANPPRAISITLNEIDDATAATLGIDARPAFAIGDWIYPFKPSAGLQDPNNPAMVAGTEVFPSRERVLDRERSLPEGWTVTMRRPDGTSFVLPGVIHDAARTVLTVGSQRPEWVVDPQGRAEGMQFAEWYKSKNRG